MDYLDLTITKESRKTESALCAILGKTFGKESVVTALVPKKPVALTVSSINIDSGENKNNSSTYKIYNDSEDVSFCELKVILCRLKSTILIEKEVRVQNSALVSKRQVMLCRLRLTLLVENDVILQKSALSSKYKRYV